MDKRYLKPEVQVVLAWAGSPLCVSGGDLSGQANDYGSGNTPGSDIANDDIIDGGTF